MRLGTSRNCPRLIVTLFALALVAVLLKPAAAQRGSDTTNEPALKPPAAPVAQDGGSSTGATAQARNMIAQGGNSSGYDMAPETRLEVVEAAVAAIPSKLPPGPFKPTWESLKENYKVPQWFIDAKFGLFMHWGLYAVPAYHSEWYEKHMYGAYIQWHKEHFGPQDKFGYKDFIPLFTAEKWDPDAWAELFKKSGARYVIPTAQHHDNFALWDSAVTPFNAKQMGPKRDLIGDLAKAVRAKGLKFGVSNHGIENFQFINPPADLAADLKAKQADLYDPKWNDFYNVADRSDAACEKFLVNWFERNVELIDKYQPDMLWFDNGVDIRYLDPLKLRVAAYYYNRAKEWGKEVSLSTKKAAYAPSGSNTQTIGSIIDFEKIGSRSPAGIRTGAWQVDDPIGSTWGYTSDMTVSGPGSIISKLADTVSKNGNLLLNLSPKADGTIPDAQQKTLLEVGRWLDVNGDAIYGTHNWIEFGEGGGRGQQGLNVRFTVKGDILYAIILGNWPGEQAIVASLATGRAPEGKITSVTMLGNSGELQFSRDAEGLKVKLPATAPCKYAYTVKIAGLKMNPPTAPAPDLARNPASSAPVLNPKLPTIFVVGDSTVARVNGQPQQGWAVPFADYFDQTKVNIVNRARGGRSSRTFITEGLWNDLLADMKSGDVVLIQLGHNDSGALNDTSRARGSIKGIGEETEEIDNLLTKKHEVVHTYGWYLRKFITDTRAKGATPIVCSPVPRKTWKDGKIVRNKNDYGGWAEAVAKAAGVAFVDLNEIIARRYDELGPDKVDPLFSDEHTHTSVAGAELNAECVIAGLKALTSDPLEPYLRAEKQ